VPVVAIVCSGNMMGRVTFEYSLGVADLLRCSRERDRAKVSGAAVRVDAVGGALAVGDGSGESASKVA
jgi:hypothetical protein